MKDDNKVWLIGIAILFVLIIVGANIYTLLMVSLTKYQLKQEIKTIPAQELRGIIKEVKNATQNNGNQGGSQGIGKFIPFPTGASP